MGFGRVYLVPKQQKVYLNKTFAHTFNYGTVLYGIFFRPPKVE
jgi:hypothetical protein